MTSILLSLVVVAGAILPLQAHDGLSAGDAIVYNVPVVYQAPVIYYGPVFYQLAAAYPSCFMPCVTTGPRVWGNSSYHIYESAGTYQSSYYCTPTVISFGHIQAAQQGYRFGLHR